MTIHLDTSALVGGISDEGGISSLQTATGRGDTLTLSSIALYEWRRGPRTPEELALALALFPDESIVSFGPAEAHLAAQLYRSVARARARGMDIAIAACAIEHRAALWTLNPKDFQDIPGLRLYEA